MALSSGSDALDRMVEKLAGTPDPKRRYEYVLWLAKKLKPLPVDQQTEAIKVQGCVSQVFVQGVLDQGVMHWQGDSDALITKGLLALLIQGLDGLTPE
jgi:cysteine desulfuration protein SufE